MKDSLFHRMRIITENNISNLNFVFIHDLRTAQQYFDSQEQFLSVRRLNHIIICSNNKTGMFIFRKRFRGKEDYKDMEHSTFEERCAKYANKLQAIGVITGLRYGIHNTFETPYLIAIAGCNALIHQRTA